MPLGPRDKQNLALYTGWDATELKKFQLADGTTYDAVFAMLNGALGALAAEFSTGLWGGLCYFTDQPEISYRVGTSNGMEEHTEYGTPDEKRASIEGHMVPLKGWDRALGWSYDYLEDARMSDIEADIADAVKDVRDKWRTKILTRALQRGDDSGSNSGLGSAGYSPGFATAAASTSVDFTPPSYGGLTFTSDHEHYVGIAGGAFTNAVFEDAYDELREHGHEPPFDFLISNSDRTIIEGLSKFVKRSDPQVQLGLTQDQALVSTEFVGVIENFRVREVFGMPQYYGFGYKTYGNLSRRNPLAIRFPKGQVAPMPTAFSDPRRGSPVVPLQYMMLILKFGVGVNDRTAGTARYTNSATWADGTPT